MEPFEVQDLELRNLLKEELKTRGGDWDGDIVVLNGRSYWVDIAHDIVQERGV